MSTFKKHCGMCGAPRVSNEVACRVCGRPFPLVDNEPGKQKWFGEDGRKDQQNFL